MCLKLFKIFNMYPYRILANCPPLDINFKREKINSLKPYFCAGPDGIPAIVLNMRLYTFNLCSYPFQSLFLSQAVFPTSWKIYLIVLIHKNVKRTTFISIALSPYRHLSAILKIFESFIWDLFLWKLHV